MNVATPVPCSVRLRLAPRAVLVATLAFAAASTALAQLKDNVRTQQGLVAGRPGTDPSIMVFKGLPFAAPPVGDLRWKAPQPPASWTGVRQADKFGPSPIQIGRAHV